MKNLNKAVMDSKEFKDINSGREVFYNFLSRSFKTEVNEEYLEMLFSLMPYIDNITAQSDIEQLKKGGELLKECVENLRHLTVNEKQEVLLDLARDFTYIFIVGTKFVPTSESVYLSPEHLVKQEPRDMVMKVYRETGFSVSKNFNEPEDHIALEFEFIANLSRLVCRAVDDNDKDKVSEYLKCQKNFIEEHLNKWIPQFCSFLMRSAEDRVFYKALAYLTEGFLIVDYEFIKEATRPQNLWVDL